MDGFHKIFVLILDAFSIQFHFWRNYVVFKVFRNTFFTTTLSYHNKIPVSTQNIILNSNFVLFDSTYLHFFGIVVEFDRFYA